MCSILNFTKAVVVVVAVAAAVVFVIVMAGWIRITNTSITRRGVMTSGGWME